MTEKAKHGFFQQATEDELQMMLLIIDQNQHAVWHWEVLVNWARGNEPAIPAARMISIMQEIAERYR